MLKTLKSGPSEQRILMLGLDNSGKTTALKQLAGVRARAPACVHHTVATQPPRARAPSASSGGCEPDHADAGLQHQVSEAGQLQPQRVGHWRCVAPT